MTLGMISPGYKKSDFEKIKSYGVDFAEFCVNSNEDDTQPYFCGHTADIYKDCADCGLKVGSVGRWGGERILSDGKINQTAMSADLALITAAAQMNSPVFTVGCNYVDGLSLYENCRAAIGYFEPLLDAGKKVGVKIATYNCRWENFVHSDPVWSIIHGYLKDLYIKFDPSHSIYAQGENYLCEINKWGDRFAHVHIKGSLLVNGERVDDPPAGLDMTNWSAVMGLLYSKGYDGGLSIEPHSGIWRGELGEAGIRRTVSYMRELMVK